MKSPHTRYIILALLAAVASRQGAVAVAQQPPEQPQGDQAPQNQPAESPNRELPGMPGSGGLFLMMLAGQKSVQNELGISLGQRQDLDALRRQLQKESNAEQRAGPPRDLPPGFNGSRGLVPVDNSKLQKEAETQLGTILTDDQTARLKQISLQMEGPKALLSPQIAQKLQLSDEQIKKLGRLTPWDSKKVNGLLNDEQQATWQEMTGPPFRGQLAYP